MSAISKKLILFTLIVLIYDYTLLGEKDYHTCKIFNPKKEPAIFKCECHLPGRRIVAYEPEGIEVNITCNWVDHPWKLQCLGIFGMVVMLILTGTLPWASKQRRVLHLICYFVFTVLGYISLIWNKVADYYFPCPPQTVFGENGSCTFMWYEYSVHALNVLLTTIIFFKLINLELLELFFRGLKYYTLEVLKD